MTESSSDQAERDQGQLAHVILRPGPQAAPPPASVLSPAGGFCLEVSANHAYYLTLGKDNGHLSSIQKKKKLLGPFKRSVSVARLGKSTLIHSRFHSSLGQIPGKSLSLGGRGAAALWWLLSAPALVGSEGGTQDWAEGEDEGQTATQSRQGLRWPLRQPGSPVALRAVLLQAKGLGL